MENEAPTFGLRFGFFLVLTIYIGALTSLLKAIRSIMLFGAFSWGLYLPTKTP